MGLMRDRREMCGDEEGKLSKVATNDLDRGNEGESELPK